MPIFYCQIETNLALAPGTQWGRVIKLAINVSFTPKMRHTTFEKNWPCNFQEVKNVQMLTHDDRPKQKCNRTWMTQLANLKR